MFSTRAHTQVNVGGDRGANLPCCGNHTVHSHGVTVAQWSWGGGSEQVSKAPLS